MHQRKSQIKHIENTKIKNNVPELSQLRFHLVILGKIPRVIYDRRWQKYAHYPAKFFYCYRKRDQNYCVF